MTGPDPFTVASTAADDEHVDVPRDQYGRYMLPKPADGRGKAVPWTRATTFAKTLSDSFALSQWFQRMAIKGLSQRPDLFALASATPLDDRKTLNDVAERAKEAAGAGAAASLGTALHTFTEQVDRGESPDIPEPWVHDVAAYRAALSAAGISVEPGYIERVVVVPRFQVAGTFDRILRMRDGRLVIGDVKTGRDLTYGWQDISVQLALYANAEAIFDLRTGMYEKMPEVDRTTAVVMHVPVGKAECTLYEVDIVAGWRAAEWCRTVRDWRKDRSIARPMLVSAGSGTTAISVVERLEAASTEDELRAIWENSLVSGTWTPAAMTVLKKKVEWLKAG